MQIIHERRKVGDESSFTIALSVIPVIQCIDGIVSFQQRVDHMLVSSRMFGIAMRQDHNGRR